MQKSAKAIASFQKTLDLDPSNSEALSGYRSCAADGANDPQQVRARAMADPEVEYT